MFELRIVGSAVMCFDWRIHAMAIQGDPSDLPLGSLVSKCQQLPEGYDETKMRYKDAMEAVAEAKRVEKSAKCFAAAMMRQSQTEPQTEDMPAKALSLLSNMRGRSNTCEQY